MAPDAEVRPWAIGRHPNTASRRRPVFPNTESRRRAADQNTANRRRPVRWLHAAASGLGYAPRPALTSFPRPALSSPRPLQPVSINILPRVYSSHPTPSICLHPACYQATNRSFASPTNRTSTTHTWRTSSSGARSGRPATHFRASRRHGANAAAAAAASAHAIAPQEAAEEALRAKVRAESGLVRVDHALRRLLDRHHRNPERSAVAAQMLASTSASGAGGATGATIARLACGDAPRVVYFEPKDERQMRSEAPGRPNAAAGVRAALANSAGASIVTEAATPASAHARPAAVRQPASLAGDFAAGRLGYHAWTLSGVKQADVEEAAGAAATGSVDGGGDKGGAEGAVEGATYGNGCRGGGVEAAEEPYFSLVGTRCVERVIEEHVPSPRKQLPRSRRLIQACSERRAGHLLAKVPIDGALRSRQMYNKSGGNAPLPAAVRAQSKSKGPALERDAVSGAIVLSAPDESMRQKRRAARAAAKAAKRAVKPPSFGVRVWRRATARLRRGWARLKAVSLYALRTLADFFLTDGFDAITAKEFRREALAVAGRSGPQASSNKFAGSFKQGAGSFRQWNGSVRQRSGSIMLADGSFAQGGSAHRRDSLGGGSMRARVLALGALTKHRSPSSSVSSSVSRASFGRSRGSSTQSVLALAEQHPPAAHRVRGATGGPERHASHNGILAALSRRFTGRRASAAADSAERRQLPFPLSKFWRPRGGLGTRRGVVDPIDASSRELMVLFGRGLTEHAAEVHQAMQAAPFAAWGGGGVGAGSPFRVRPSPHEPRRAACASPSKYAQGGASPLAARMGSATGAGSPNGRNSAHGRYAARGGASPADVRAPAKSQVDLMVEARQHAVVNRSLGMELRELTEERRELQEELKQHARGGWGRAADGSFSAGSFSRANSSFGKRSGGGSSFGKGGGGSSFGKRGRSSRLQLLSASASAYASAATTGGLVAGDDAGAAVASRLTQVENRVKGVIVKIASQAVRTREMREEMELDAFMSQFGLNGQCGKGVASSARPAGSGQLRAGSKWGLVQKAAPTAAEAARAAAAAVLEAEEAAEASRERARRSSTSWCTLALPSLILVLLLLGGGVATAALALWARTDGTTPPEWPTAVGLGLGLSWLVVEPLILSWRYAVHLARDSARQECDRHDYSAMADEERRALYEHARVRRLARMGPVARQLKVQHGAPRPGTRCDQGDVAMAHAPRLLNLKPGSRPDTTMRSVTYAV